MKREFLMLAHTLNSFNDENIRGWYMSEKLDGLRLWWDGGISRGLPIIDVPYANYAKDVNIDYRATGLWSRNAKCIRCPDWFLDRLPKFPLDGEIWAGRQSMQLTSSIVKQHVPDDKDWEKVKFMVFDCPPFDIIFKDGEVSNEIHKATFNKSVLDWSMYRAKELGVQTEPNTREFEFMLAWLRNQRINNLSVELVQQQRLPLDSAECERIINQMMVEVREKKGEGVMLRNNMSYWTPERTHHLLRVKPWHDAEGKVVYYVWGKKTDKGSKHLGRMGTLGVEWEGKIFEVSGFNDNERELVHADGRLAESIGRIFAGQIVEPGIINHKFPIGCKITFKYRDLTDLGIPKNANYLRKFDNA